ncbi:hypothetical protein Taro_038910 [Colocasia esculenta]|uniref:Uncharacterized protein n=1 Tax=Colocasia esculenta TaxID=4460 RepID=A0A843W9B0_COLES|nr:hypothetical protein [Colocasia esculenta]
MGTIPLTDPYTQPQPVFLQPEGKTTTLDTTSLVINSDLVKAFFTCLKSEEDGSLSSSVKCTTIHITYDLLESLFGVSTVGRSRVDSVDILAKGLGIFGTEYKVKDGKIDINQLNAFNRVLHFIVCQILLPRSATFSTCPKADSDIMFWVIQNQDINMAQREVSEKMGQPIRSRNLKKSGFSLVGSVWTKTSMAEGEAIIGEAPTIPEILVVQEEEAEVRSDELATSARRIEEIAPEHIEPVGQQSEVETPSTVIASVIEEVLETVASIQGEQEEIYEEIP